MTINETPREVIWCPHCGNDIFSDTLVCWHCNRPVEEIDYDGYYSDYDYDYDPSEEEVG